MKYCTSMEKTIILFQFTFNHINAYGDILHKQKTDNDSVNSYQPNHKYFLIIQTEH